MSHILKRITALYDRNIPVHSRVPISRLLIPVFNGYRDAKSAADFWLKIYTWRHIFPMSLYCVGKMVVALGGSAARWWTSQANFPFSSLEDFKRHFRV